MEPLDFCKNDENSVSSRRRISSILKVSRKSTRSPDPDQQENEVECAKPIEKRNSRRVSFAPANDVLLFSKDVKNVRSPFQELMTTAIPAQNSVHVSIGEDGKQQIMGMAPLISAPLHGSELKGNVNFELGEVFGEKTVMYSEDDGLMEMTQSHTINIADSEDYLTYAAQKKKTAMSSADSKSVNTSLCDNTNITREFQMACAGKVTGSRVMSSVPSVDPSFNLLCSRSKSSGLNLKFYGTTLETTMSQMKIQKIDVDKENQASTLLSSEMGKSTTNSRSIGPSQDDDGKMDRTVAHTVAGLTDDADDPFRCLFPQQEMYSQPDTASQARRNPKALQEQTTITLGSLNTKGTASQNFCECATDLTNIVRNKYCLIPNRFEKGKAEGVTLQTTDTSSLKNHFHALQWHKDNLNEKSTEKTIRLTTDDACMDMTRSDTVQITGELAPPPAPNLLCEGKRSFLVSSMETKLRETTGPPVSSEIILDSNFEKFLTNIFKPEGPSVNSGHAGIAPMNTLLRANEQASNGHPILPKDDLNMNVTEFQKGHTKEIGRTDEPLQCLQLQSGQTTFPQLLSNEQRSSNNTGKETDLRRPWKHQINSDTQDDCREQTLRFTTDHSNLEVTQSCCVSTASTSIMQSHKIRDTLPTGDKRTARFATNDGAMDMTQSLTGNIDTPFACKNIHAVPAGGEKTIRFPANDAAMDMTQSVTVNIETPFEPGAPKNVYSQHSGGIKTIRFSTNDAEEDVTGKFTSNIAPDAHQNVNFEAAGGEKTFLLSASDSAMDVMQNQARNIAAPLEPGAPRNEPSGGEQTVRFPEMNVTRSLTVNVDALFEPGTHQNVDFVPVGGEKLIRFSANATAMDVTRSLTINMDAPFEPGAQQNVDFVPATEEKLIRFSANATAMDMTQCLTTNIEKNLEADAQQTVPETWPENDVDMEHIQQKNEFLTSEEERTLRLTANDVAMDVTQSHTVNIAGRFEIPPAKKQDETFGVAKKKSLSVLSFNPGQNIFCKTASLCKADLPAEASFDTNHFMPTKTSALNNKSEVPGAKDHQEKFFSPEKNMDDSSHAVETDVSIELTEGQAAAGAGCSDEPHRCQSTTPHGHANVQEMTSQQTSHELTHDWSQKSPDPDLTNQSSPSLQKVNSPHASDHDTDSNPSRQSKRLSLADIQFKMKRLSHVINETSEMTAADSYAAAPLPYLDADKNAKDDNDLTLEFVPDVKTGKTDDEVTQSGRHDKVTVRTPFKCKTTELMLRLSTGCFKPKLPQRNRIDEPKVDFEEKTGSQATVDNVTNNLNRWNDDDASDIYDEELASCEDLSETLDPENPPRISERAIAFEQFNIDEALLADCFQGNSPNASQAIKRSLPSPENSPEDKKMKPSTVATEMATRDLDYDRVNVTTIPTMSNQTMDSSSSTHSNSSRCDTTFNSTFKHSMLESHLEDSDVQKLMDGSITVLEFFKLFNIDFVIHKPRQSVLPGALPRGTGCSAMDVLKNRHICRPKQMVYESDFQILSGKVEGLSCRTLDLNKPLKMVNKHLWENVKKSSEKEIKSFGAKLKERNNFFRKMSKVRAHEMKEALYSDLVRNLADEQQKLRSSIESNEMIKMLDACILDLEAEIAAVEEKGTENMPSLKSLQEEMKKVSEALDDNNRQIYELEAQKKQASNKLGGLKAETKNLQSFLGVLEPLNEWRFREKTENYTLYTFLHCTLHLQMAHAGNSADKEPERKTSQINFKFQLDDEKSQSHARLVHKLLSQYVEGETGWVEKYPTSSYIPELLHDVSLVVSNCRLLGEELQLLEIWGGSRLNIVDMSCEDTRVKIAFSSVRRRCKFEVTLSVSLAKHLYVLQVHAFKSIIGDTTAEHIEQIVESFTPAKKLLTKIVKKINCDRLC
ncbi:uncharacterized protein knl1 isoform X2 [Festucalex cinctus]